MAQTETIRQMIDGKDFYVEIEMFPDTVLYDVFQNGENVKTIQSERPFRLGMEHDGSTRNCMVVMFADYCRIKKSGTVKDLVQDRFWRQFKQAMNIGMKEGIVFPRWTETNKELLRDGLDEVGLSDLASHVV